MAQNPNLPYMTPWLDRADKIGSALSSLCAVHCIAMPLLIGLLPVIGFSFLASEGFEKGAAITMIFLAAMCLWSGCRIHQRWGVFALMLVGASVILFTQFGGADTHVEGADWHEAIAMMVGGSLIALSHLINLRLRGRCACAPCHTYPKYIRNVVT